MLKLHLEHNLHDTSLEEFIELVCEHMDAVIVRTVAGHPTPKSVLRSAST